MCVCEREPDMRFATSRLCPITDHPPSSYPSSPLSLCKVAVFRLLVGKYGARLDTITSIKNGLLHVASEAGALDVARLLLEEHG